MVKINRTKTPPASLEIEKLKLNGSYTQPDVIEQLESDFFEKCYICEMNDLQAPQVEHFIPHENGKYIDLKFDWNNLFLSCSRCNSIKNQNKYSNKIIDCTKEDPEKYLNCILKENDVEIKSNDKKADITAELIYEAFILKNTGLRIKTSDVTLKKLREEMNIFYKILKRYKDSKKSKNLKKYKRRKCSVIGSLGRETPFASFKRYYIRQNIDIYPEFQEYICFYETDEPIK